MLHNLTMKFGGTSVGKAEAISQVVEIVRQTLKSEADQVAIVVSAMRGVTDLLKEGTLAAAAGEPHRYQSITKQLRQRHHTVADELSMHGQESVVRQIDELIDRYQRFCDSIYVLGELTPRALDHTMGLGEQMSSILVAAALQQAGLPGIAVDASRMIVTDDQFQAAAPLLDLIYPLIKKELLPILRQGGIPVVTGFIGATREGVRTTLGRGGSDYSAALIGVGIDSDEVWIWTDVDGVMSADPKMVPEARSIKTLSYTEVGELAYFGARVLHPKTIRPVVEAEIPLRVKNTFNPSHPGTLILAEAETNGAIKAVTAIPHMSLITVAGRGMMGVPGIAARTFSAVAQTSTSVLLISQASSEQSICFVVPQSRSRPVIEALNHEFEPEIARHDIDLVSALDGVSIITIIGAGMRGTPAVAGKIFSSTGQADVNVVAIAQGSSECSISLVVDGKDQMKGVSAIHALTLAMNGRIE